MPDPTTPSHATPQADATNYLHPQTLARLGTFELRAKMVVEGVMSGMHRSPYHGFSVEFAQHRPYVAGDDIRHLDWKVYGRSDKLHLKQYEQETSLDLVLLVDASGSMRYGSRSYADASGKGEDLSADGRTNWTKFDHATATAAALAHLALKQGDRVGLGVYADQMMGLLSRTGASDQWRRIVGMLSTHPVEKAANLGRVIDQTIAKLNNKCLIAIISDFYEDPAEIRTALARLRHRSHDVILLQVIDEKEESFDFTDSLPFLGLEDEGRVRVDPRALKKEYLKAFHAHREQVEKTAKSFGFDYQRVCTHEWLGPPLAAFVARRNSIIKRSKIG